MEGHGYAFWKYASRLIYCGGAEVCLLELCSETTLRAVIEQAGGQ